MPDWGTVLPTADVAAGKTISAKLRAVPRHCPRPGPTRSARRFTAWSAAPAPRIAGFDYSSAMKAKGGNWTYDELFKFMKSPRRLYPRHQDELRRPVARARTAST